MTRRIILSQDKCWWCEPGTMTVAEVNDEQWARLLDGVPPEKLNLESVGKCSDIIDAGIARSRFGLDMPED